MGEHEGRAQPSGLLPNGLLLDAGPMIRVLHSERWLKAEERTAELITCIQPNQPSEERRNAVANYVQRLIMKCFPCQVFTFGSVPLKTYLPDGDIDLSAFSDNQNLKDTWANQVRDALESEEKNEIAEFHVKEVQYIQAEVKIIKCLVENIVVDISFNQLGGLCTLCFLEQVDHLINQNHLFKRSIILIKAWCYYESRILGAHHGLISTYALETLVLYIFHVFNNSFAGPLEVLYRFLEFFSNYDWDNFCVSLWGPVPVSSLPDVTAEPPRKDSGELLLNKYFLDYCSSAYAVFPSSQENQGQPFVSKHFNVIDPLRINNNLGRSVSKGNFFRIRSAFAFGAKKLARLLDCPKENVFFEVNQFFMNTWDRHGNGHRPDAPTIDLWHVRLSTPDHSHGPENLKNNSSGRRVNDKSYGRETEVEEAQSPSASRAQSQKNYVNLNNVRNSDQIVGNVSSNQRIFESGHMVNDIQGRFLFARTRSSPELTDTYSNISSRGRRNRAPESGKNQANPARMDGNRRKNIGSEILASHSGRSSTDDPSSAMHALSHQRVDASAEMNTGSNYYHRDELSSVTGSQGMHQEEQDLVNLMASGNFPGFNGQVHVPFNLGSAHLPLPISPSVLASMGYAQRNFAGMGPSNIPVIDPSFPNLQFPHGLVSPSLTHYFSGIGLTSNSEDSIEPGNENYTSMEMNSGEADRDFWQEGDAGSTVGLDPDNGNFENHQDNFQYQDNRGNGVYADERTESSRFSSTAHSSSLRSKTSSESSWDGSSAKGSKPARERWGKKSIPSEPSIVPGNSKGMSKQVATQAEEDDRDWNSLSSMDTGIAERSLGPQSVGSLHGSRHHIHGYEPAQTSGTDSMIPITPMMLGHGSRQSVVDNSGVPFAFYPTGPPVPFLFYNIPSETGASEASTSNFDDKSDTDQNFDSSEGRDRSEDLSTSDSLRRSSSVETPDEHRSDILNSDFISHWQNLQFGRFCQNPRYPSPVICSSPVMVPPMYLQGGPGRPPSGNTNLFTQLVNYGPRLVPVAPLQSFSNRPPNVYQRYVDDLRRYRSGTGTYLPNPKVSLRDRHSSLTRKGSFNYDRSDNHADREGNWNTNSKPRAAGRNHGRSQTEKSSSRFDRLASGESRADRSWGSFRHDSVQTQNGPLRSNPSQSGLPSVAYGMYPLPAMNVNGVSSNGPTVPSVVMLYPFDHNNASYGPLSEQLEFGSLGPVFLSGTNEQSQASDGRRAFEEHRYHEGSVQRSSPDQPSSPQHQRRV